VRVVLGAAGLCFVCLRRRRPPAQRAHAAACGAVRWRWRAGAVHAAARQTGGVGARTGVVTRARAFPAGGGAHGGKRCCAVLAAASLARAGASACASPPNAKRNIMAVVARAPPAEAAPGRSQRRAALGYSNEGGGTLKRAILCSVERFV
jgi:hypothetical protein